MIHYILAALAVWRLSVLLVEEEGPRHIFAILRSRSGIEVYPDGTVIVPGTIVAGVLACTRCASMWIAVPVTLMLWPGDDWRAWILTPLALSGAAVLAEVFRRR